MHVNGLNRPIFTGKSSLFFLIIASAYLAPAFGQVKPARNDSSGRSATSRGVQTRRVADRRRLKNVTRLALRGGDQWGQYRVLRRHGFSLAAGSNPSSTKQPSGLSPAIVGAAGYEKLNAFSQRPRINGRTLGNYATLLGSGNNSVANAGGGSLSNAGRFSLPIARAALNSNASTANIRGLVDPLITSAWNAGTGNWSNATA